MIAFLKNFFPISGHHAYLSIAYACVIVTLFLTWLLPWRRWKKYLHNQKISADYEQST